jgi:ATP-binding cassette subfamily B protein
MQKNNDVFFWLYRNSRPHIPMMILLVPGNAAFAVCGVGFAMLSRSVVDGAVAGDKDTFIHFTLLLLGIILLQLFLRLLCRHLEETIKARLEMSFKNQLFAKLLYKDFVSLSTWHSGELLNHLTSDVAIISEGVTTMVPSLVSMLTRLTCAFAVLVSIDGTFALVFAAGGILLFLVIGAFRSLMKRMHKKVLETDGKLRSYMQEALENLLVLKIFAAQKQMTDQVSKLQDLHYAAKMKRMHASIFANSGFSFIFQMGYLYALVWSAYKLYTHSISFGTLAAILQLVGQVQTPFIGLSGLLPKYYGVLASVERIMALENLRDEAQANTETDTNNLDSGLAEVVFDKVSFRYDRDIILENASLRLEKHDFALLSGPSGIGKTTLLKLLLGMYKPDEGQIYLQMNDGSRISIGQHTRKWFAFVPQGNLLLSGSIRENIAFVKPEATDDEIMAAARISCADDFIKDLPEGLETMIGEKGYGLSEGQIQRLAIARAVLSGPSVLLLDEASSALDESIEKRLLQNLREMPDKTCLIISHRRAPLSICNKELFIENKAIYTRGVKQDERKTG